MPLTHSQFTNSPKVARSLLPPSLALSAAAFSSSISPLAMSIMSLAVGRARGGVRGVSWPQPRVCKFAGLQIERFYNVGRQRIEGSCPLVGAHCLQDKLLGFRRGRFGNNIGNTQR